MRAACFVKCELLNSRKNNQEMGSRLLTTHLYSKPDPSEFFGREDFENMLEVSTRVKNRRVDLAQHDIG
eukprot:4892467-Amphidinium_carterae.1